MNDKLKKFNIKGSNILHVSLTKLTELGYKQRHFTGKLGYKQNPYSEEGDLLCLVNSDKNMWAILDSKSAKSIDPAKFLVYYI